MGSCGDLSQVVDGQSRRQIGAVNNTPIPNSIGENAVVEVPVAGQIAVSDRIGIEVESSQIGGDCSERIGVYVSCCEIGSVQIVGIDMRKEIGRRTDGIGACLIGKNIVDIDSILVSGLSLDSEVFADG